jgi:hypothetical protein
VPLILDLALSTELTPDAWDHESFAAEVGRRHGPAARGVVETLVNWAEHRERELAAATGVATRSLTRFPMIGVTAEPELMFPVDLNLEPRGSQPTISIHADGRVVVWLGGMRHPPFDTEGARHELRRAINEISGVHLQRRQVNGWPRFVLSALEDPANLQYLVTVLDRVATESYTAAPREAVGMEGRLIGDKDVLERTFLGVVEVDSGTLRVGDPTYCLPHAQSGRAGIDYEVVIKAPSEPAGYLAGQPVLLLGSFGGDGNFPLFGEFDEDGELIRVTVEFVGPEEDD